MSYTYSLRLQRYAISLDYPNKIIKSLIIMFMIIMFMIIMFMIISPWGLTAPGRIGFHGKGLLNCRLTI